MNTTTPTATIAFIPAIRTDLYPTWGIDLGIGAAYDENGAQETDYQHVAWVELGDFPVEEAGDTVTFDKEVRWDLEDAVPAYRIDWDTLTLTGEYWTVAVEAL